MPVILTIFVFKSRIFFFFFFEIVNSREIQIDTPKNHGIYDFGDFIPLLKPTLGPCCLANCFFHLTVCPGHLYISVNVGLHHCIQCLHRVLLHTCPALAELSEHSPAPCCYKSCDREHSCAHLCHFCDYFSNMRVYIFYTCALAPSRIAFLVP